MLKLLEALAGWETADLLWAHAKVLMLPLVLSWPPLHLLHPVHTTSIDQCVEFLEELTVLYVAPLYVPGSVRPLKWLEISVGWLSLS